MQRLRLLTGTFAQTLAIVLAGGLITALLFAKISKLEEHKIALEFERRAVVRVDAIKDGLERAVRDLTIVNRLFVTVGAVSEEQFGHFTRPLLVRNPGIQNFAFQRIVSAAARPAFEAKMRSHYPDFRITEMVDGKPASAQPRSHYRVIEYLEPMRGNEAAFGLDVDSRPRQDAARDNACRTGLPAASQSYRLAQQSDAERGFVLLMPVYRPGAPTADTQARCHEVAGYTSAVFNGARLMRSTLAQKRLDRTKDFGIAVYSGDTRSDENLIFQTGHVEFSEPGPARWLRKLLYKQADDYSGSFEIAERPWQVIVSPLPAPLIKSHAASLLTLLGGVLISLLSGIYMHAIGLRSRRIQHLMETRTAELARVQDLLDRNHLLGAERSRLLTLFEQAPGFIAILEGPDHVFRIVNAAYYQLIGARDIIGKPMRDALSELDGQGFFELLDQVFATGVPHVGRGVPVVIRKRPGAAPETCHVDFVYQPITDMDGRVTGLFVQGNDVSQEKASQLQLEYLTTHDTLTGLPNHALLRDRLGQALLRAETEGQQVAVMVLDLDRFTFIQESLGQVPAEALLKVVADRLQGTLRGSDTVARLDNDKFVLMAPVDVCGDECASMAQRVMETVSRPAGVDGQEFFLSCSLGIAAYPADARDADALMHCADLAMRRAQQTGGNNFQFYTPVMNERTRERLKIVGALRNALDRSELVLHYQPQVDLVSGHIVGMEALIRWQHPELGMVPPATFIGLAEETGLIVPIGAWVLRTACRQAKAWQDAGLGKLRVAVNLSARQFSQHDIAAVITAVLEETGLAPDCLDIELTESLVMLDVDHAVGVLRALKTLGVKISIDDFGTGYSSLAYLKRFPIDVLKIDRSFVHEISSDANDAAISNAIISMAHSLGIQVIAEGVETEDQCAFLAHNMCDQIQGFLFSRALPDEQMEALLREGRRLPEHLLRLHKRLLTLLLVDDEPGILAALKRQLRGKGYRILTAGSGADGLALLAENDVDVILSDQRMPGMTGVEFLRTVKTLYPDTVRMVLSGFTELKSVTDAINEGAIYKFLTKPWDDDRLLAHIQEAFQHKEMVNENRRLDMEVRAANQKLANANRLLEEGLAQQQLRIKRSEASLDIVREALQHVPLPVIGLDDEEMIVLANHAAQALFSAKGAILGSEAAQIMPELLQALRAEAERGEAIVEIDGTRYRPVSRSMGNGTLSRGRLITLLALNGHLLIVA